MQADQLQSFYHRLSYLGKISVAFRWLIVVIHLTMMQVSVAQAHCLLLTCTVYMNLRVVAKHEILCTYLAPPPLTLEIKYLIQLT